LIENKSHANLYVVTNPVAISQKTLSASRLSSAKIDLTKSAWYERDQLIAHLQAIGYVKNDLAEDVGFFSVRGHLVDVFSTLDDLPLRIEFFGDEILSLRRFDPQTQRSEAELQSISIFPARELLLFQKDLPEFRRKLKDLGDQKGVSREE